MARPASSLNRPNTCTHTHKQRNKIQTHIYTDSFTPAYPLIHLPLHHNLKPSKYHTHTHTHTHEQRNKIHTHIYTNSFTPTYPHIHLPLYHNLKPSKYHTHTHTHTHTQTHALSHTHTHTHIKVVHPLKSKKCVFVYNMQAYHREQQLQCSIVN